MRELRIRKRRVTHVDMAHLAVVIHVEHEVVGVDGGEVSLLHAFSEENVLQSVWSVCANTASTASAKFTFLFNKNTVNLS